MNETFFTPEEIDEQIERLRADQPTQPSEEAARSTIAGLNGFYEVNTPNDTPSLQRVWQRVLDVEEQERAQSAAVKQSPEQMEPGILSDTPPERPSSSPRRASKRSRLLLTQLVAIVCLLLIAGSFVWFINRSDQVHLTSGTATAISTGKSSGNLYAYLGQTLYRLDSQTRHILWQHTFASNERIENAPAGPQPLHSSTFSVGNIMYVLIQDTQRTNLQYLYAFNQSSGSLLWKLPSARPLANAHAIYTLVESKTSDVSTLTARNPQTGQQLWQKQYPIVGYRGDPGYGTDATEGFRLVAVNDQVLYAVRSYHQNGQDFFARYALSASDGAIIWQNSQLIIGRMPDVEAQIADSVIYTSEYNLKAVKAHTDSHGMTISEIPQMQIVAYDVQTGKKLWNTPEEVGGEPNPDVSLNVTNTMLYYEVYNQNWLTSGPQYNISTSTLYALSRTDGATQWRYQVKDTTMTEAVLDDKNLYVETTRLVNQQPSTNVVALDQQKGTLSWSTPVDAMSKHAATPTPEPPTSTPRGPEGDTGVFLDIAPVVSYGVVYYSSAGNNVYALGAADGKVLTQFSIGPSGHSTIFDRPFFFVVP